MMFATVLLAIFVFLTRFPVVHTQILLIIMTIDECINRKELTEARCAARAETAAL